MSPDGEGREVPFPPHVVGAFLWARTQDVPPWIDLHEQWCDHARAFRRYRGWWDPPAGRLLYHVWATRVAMLAAGEEFDMIGVLDDVYGTPREREEDGTRWPEEVLQEQ